MRQKPARIAGFLLALLAGIVLFPGCSINKLAVNALADVLGGEGGASTFTTDEDPELVGESLPFALKLYETILEQTPDNEGLLFGTGSGFISYANAFVATPASMLPFEEWEKQQADQVRAKKLYLRGRDYLIHGLDVRYPGFREVLEREGPTARDDLEVFVEQMDEEDVGFLYWIGAGWVSAFALDAFDLQLGITVPKSLVLMVRALELDETYSDGSIHDFLVQYYASLPEAMGGDKSKVAYHHERALEIADGRLAGPYVSYAESVVLPSQSSIRLPEGDTEEEMTAYFAEIQAVADEFERLMEAALAVDVDAYPDARLVNILTQRKAQWYLDNLDDFFLLDYGEGF